MSTRLAPVLNVRDFAAERTFSESLGLPVIYEGPGYPSSLAQYPPPPELEGAGPPDRFRPLPLSCPGAESPM